MNIVRKIKLNQLGYYKFKDSENDIIELIKSRILNLKIIKIDEYPYIHFYTKNNYILFYHDFNSKMISTSFHNFYNLFIQSCTSHKEYEYLINTLLKYYYNIDNKHIFYSMFIDNNFYSEVMEILQTNVEN